MKYTHTPICNTPKTRLNLVEFQVNAQSDIFLLDTGAPQSRIHITKAEKFQIQHDGKKGVIERLQIGPFLWTNFPVSIDSSPDKSTLYHGCPTAGLFGTNLMNGLCWLFERPARKLHICEAEHAFVNQWTAGANSISIHPHVLKDIEGHVWATQSYLNGQGPIHTDLDTGAQRTILTSKAGAYLDPAEPRETIRLSSGGGVNQAESYRCHAESFEIAEVRFERPLVAVCDSIFEVAPELLDKPAILLGIDTIGENSYGFDLQNGIFWIHPHKT